MRFGTVILMRITSLDVARSDTGLESSKKMLTLDKLVVLAGPNGGGKTRILQFVKSYLAKGDYHNRRHVDDVKAQLDELKKIPEPSSPEKMIKELTLFISQAEAGTIDGQWLKEGVIDVFPKTADLSNYRDMNENDRVSFIKNLQKFGAMHLPSGTLPHIAQLCKRHAMARIAIIDKKVGGKEEEIENALAQWKEIVSLVKDFFDAALDYDLDQNPTLDGRIIDSSLSDGQRILLMMAVLIHVQVSKLNGHVLLLDEPECHLHPRIVIKIVRWLIENDKVGQIWIATHSVPLIATLPHESLWFVEKGQVSWAGRKTELILHGLLGGPESREQIEEFLRLPAQLASNRFASECLIPPKVVNTGADDPQARQVREYLQLESKNNTPLKVLDYGAGVGRLLSAMYERWDNEREFCEAIDYRAFEPGISSKEQLQSTIRSIYSDAEQQFRCAVKDEELVKIDPDSVDIVIMCNVLHEIPPDEWRQLFSSISRLLKSDNGKLLILEDTEIPHGERAHRYGFLILDNLQLYKLFSCTEKDSLKISTPDMGNSRLRVHVVPAQLLGRVTPESTKQALELLQQTARNQIKELRNQELDSRNGHLHALWTQLLANADIYVN
jgi:SAM-dependent methyltransferase